MLKKNKDDILDCYNQMVNTKPMQALYPSLGLSKAAKILAKDQAETGEIGHTASDGSSPFDRMNRFGKMGLLLLLKNVSYGYNTARAIVVQLLIDSGVPSRGHRNNILSPTFKRIGVATGSHKEYSYLCVMDFAVDYKESSNSDSDESPASTENDNASTENSSNNENVDNSSSNSDKGNSTASIIIYSTPSSSDGKQLVKDLANAGLTFVLYDVIGKDKDKNG